MTVTRLLLVPLALVLATSAPATAQDGIVTENLTQALAASSLATPTSTTEAAAQAVPVDNSFHWSAAIGQGFLFLIAQHSYRLESEEKTRVELKGDFWRDYKRSVRGLRGWNDGGKVFTNFIAHPVQGAITGYIWAQNDPRTRRIPVGASRDYWLSRLKAMAWTAAWSTQFEIGPISEASIGNVGMIPGTAGYIDLVITPVMGTVLMIAEDLSDKYLVSWVIRQTPDPWQKMIVPWLTPSRTVANAMRFHTPWYRDAPPGTGRRHVKNQDR